MADTLDDWLEEWHREGAWRASKAEVQRLVDEIERLRALLRFPDGLPEDLYTDIESEIHQHCGHDGQSDEANDWVTDLMSGLSPLILRALERPDA